MATIPGGTEGGPWELMNDIFKQQSAESQLYQKMAHDMAIQRLGTEAKMQMINQRASTRVAKAPPIDFSPEETQGLATGKLGFVKGAEPPREGDINAINTGKPVRPVKGRDGMIKGWIVERTKPGAASDGKGFVNGKPVDTQPSVTPNIPRNNATLYSPKIDPNTGKVVRGDPVQPSAAPAATDDDEE